MVDDSQVGGELSADTYGPELMSEMAQIAECKIARSHSLAWAQNLLHIVYDDSSDKDEEGSSEPGLSYPRT